MLLFIIKLDMQQFLDVVEMVRSIMVCVLF